MSTPYERSVRSVEAKLINDRILIERPAPIKSWRAYQTLLERDHFAEQYLFRGLPSWGWSLKSSLERMISDSGIPIRHSYDQYLEQGLIRRFKRQYHLYSSAVPAHRDHIEWLSIMQHHGAPTRLLDITYSGYVALYFALEGYVSGTEAAIWCFNQKWLSLGWDMMNPDKYQELYHQDKEGRFEELYDWVVKDIKPAVYVINPFRMPRRLTMQQAGFLMPTDVRLSFLQNLANMPKNPIFKNKRYDGKRRVLKLKLIFSPRALTEVRRGLNRMNINSETLFPGLDGYARSLKDRLLTREQTWAYKKGF